MTLIDQQSLALPVRQWLAHSLQVVNWGGFDGHHQITFDDQASLLTGTSGTGKSTLLDSYIALLMDSTTPFNGASNDSVTGRARSSEQRNILSYMRGKIDTYRDTKSGKLRDTLLRGEDRDTWSAMAMTWQNAGGDIYTAFRVYFAPATARNYSDVTAHFASIDGHFDLRDLEQFAIARFDHKSIRKVFPNVEFRDGYSDFSSRVTMRLGIGSRGAEAKALKLLARIQGGRNITTVDALYKTLVLEQPHTYGVADEAIAHFDDLHTSYLSMKEAEDQVEALKDAPSQYAALMAAVDNAKLLTSMRSTLPVTAATPLRYWQLGVQDSLLVKALATTQDKHREAVDAQQRAGEQVSALQTKVTDLSEQVRLSGGDALANAEGRLQQLQAQRTEMLNARDRLQRSVADLGLDLSDQSAFESAVAKASQFEQNYGTNQRELEAKVDQIKEQIWEAKRTAGQLADDLRKMQGRDTNIPHNLHQQRIELADALRVNVSDLPFAGELIDMDPDFEDWRSAAGLALGGFATTLLIDEDLVSQARRAMDGKRWRARLRFESIDPEVGLMGMPSDDDLPGRFVIADHPFGNWVLGRLIRDFNYTCVDNPADLDRVPFGLSKNGQTRQRGRGAHGGHGRESAIGFSNALRLDEMRNAVHEANVASQELEPELARRRAAVAELAESGAAYQRLVGVTWASIDVESVDGEIEVAQAAVTGAMSGSDVLDGMRAKLGELRREHVDAIGDERVAANRVAKLEGAQADYEQQRQQIAQERSQLAGAGVVASDEQDQRLTSELTLLDPDVTLESFPGAVSRLRHRITEQVEQLSKDKTVAEGALRRTFEGFQAKWPRPNLGTDPYDSYSGYVEILDDLMQQGLHERRDEWTGKVNAWSSADLLTLRRSQVEAVQDIRDRLAQVNDILCDLPFGPGGDRLHIYLRSTESQEVQAFKRELNALAADARQESDQAAVETRFLRLQRFMTQIRAGEKDSKRDALLDVRRHLYVEAERRSVEGEQLSVYTSIGDKSGGETQELVAFIVGAALRYQLGDADLPWPRYAPVFLDEGFIKADSQFAGRAVKAWRGLGFQLIIGAPNDKVSGIEPHVPLILQVTKNSENRSSVSAIERVIDLTD